jgi:hypothetical protein
VQLPAAGTDFVTWDPILGRSPNRDWRRWGTDALIVVLDTVTREFREAHPGVAPMLIADLSRPQGGPSGVATAACGHASHQNGLDADVMYPRRDGAMLAARAPGRRSIARWLRTSSTASARPARSSSSSGPTCTCAARARSSCRSSTTTTTSMCGSPTRRVPTRRTRLTRTDRAPHEEHRHARPAPARGVGGLPHRLDEQPGASSARV